MFSAGLLEDLFVPDFVGIWLLQSSSSWICLEDSAGNGLVASDTGLWVKNLELVDLGEGELSESLKTNSDMVSLTFLIKSSLILSFFS